MPSSVSTGPSTPGLQVLAAPAVVLLVSFLGYSSQWLFYTAAELGPGPLTAAESVLFNTLLLGLWWTYYKACTVDPGRYVFPDDAGAFGDKPEQQQQQAGLVDESQTQTQTRRWCKKCRAPKPPRAHHCRHCGRCIPRMDHHCPWTGNCVSLQTFPHFLRFLAYANAGLWCLAWLLYTRFAALWDARHLPAYLGPTLPQLAHLTLLGLVCGGTSLALGIMLFTTARGWALNMTMIEGWEVERHEAVVARYSPTTGTSSSSSGSGDDSWWGSDKDELLAALQRVEFPYDVGFFANMAQAMGTANPLLWFLPFAGGPAVDPDGARTGAGPGWAWEENGFNDREGMWPPPDPDKLRRARQGGWPAAATAAAAMQRHGEQEWASPEEQRAAFRARQAADLLRRERLQRRQRQRQRQRHQQGSGDIVAELEEVDDPYYDNDVEDEDEGEDEDENSYDDEDDEEEEGMDGQPGWTNADGDRLRDYGVDEDAEEEDEIVVLVPPHRYQSQSQQQQQQQDDDVPLGELLRRRRVLAREADGG